MKKAKLLKLFAYLDSRYSERHLDVLSHAERNLLRYAQTFPLLKTHVVVNVHHLQWQSRFQYYNIIGFYLGHTPEIQINALYNKNMDK